MLRQLPRKQAGFTIAELLVTTVLGLSLMSSILMGYLGVYKGSVNTLAQSKLGQEMNSLMDVMVNEVRRAGYSAETAVATSPANNSFSTYGGTALAVYDTVTSNTKQSATGSGSCLVYAYDMDANGSVSAGELSGFRLNNGVVEIRTVGNAAGPDTCSSTNNTWSALTDSTFMTVTTLTFDLSGSKCLNTRDPNGVDDDADGTIDDADESDCYAHVPTAGSGNITVETRVVGITLTAQLASDSYVKQTLNETVRVRNELVRVR